jgi:WD40 repeat protein
VAASLGQTRTGAILGTPGYMAPEQAGGSLGGKRPEEVGPAADVWALGAILYECLTGRPPFRGESAVETLFQVRALEPVPPRRVRPQVPRDLETIALKCLRKLPEHRYASAWELAEDLRRFQAGEAIRARPVGVCSRAWKWARRRPAAAGLLAVVVLTAAVGFPTTTWLWRRAESAWQREADARKEIENQNEVITTNLYLQRIATAHGEWSNGNLFRARELLAECPDHLRHWEWHYLRRLCYPDVVPLSGHSGLIRRLAFSPDSRLLAVGVGEYFGSDAPGQVKVWEVETGREVWTLPGPLPGVFGLAFAPDGRRLAVATAGVLPHQPEHVKVWDLSTREVVLALPRSVGSVLDIAYSPDGRQLVAAGLDGKVTVWDAGTGDRRHLFAGHRGDVFGVAFSPDGKRVASVGFDGTARLWDLATGRMAVVHRTHDLRGVAFSPDGRHLAVGGWDGTAKVLDLTAGSVPVLSLRPHGGAVFQVAFSPAGHYVASAAHDRSVHVWATGTGVTRRVLRGHDGHAGGFAFSPDGRWLATGGHDRTANLWDLRQELAPSSYAAHDASIHGLAFRPDGRRLALAGGAHTGSPGVGSKTLRLLNLETTRGDGEMAGHTDWLTRVAYSPDGRRLVTGGADGTARIWDEDTGRTMFVLEGHRGTVHDVAYSPDGGRVATAGADRSIRLWDSATGKPGAILSGHGDAVTGLGFGPGGRLVSGSADRTLKVWDPENGKVVRTLSGHADAVTVVRFSPVGTHLASGGRDGEVRLWDAATGEDVPLDGRHPDEVLDLTFSPDGRRLVSASRHGTLKVWDVKSGRAALAVAVPDGLTGVAFSPDGDRLAVASGGRLQFFDTQPPTTEARATAAQRVQDRIVTWHAQQARACSGAGQWSAAVFHLDRLAAAGATDWVLYARRAAEHAAQSRRPGGSDNSAKPR